MPSSRQLAAEKNVSRSTVVAVYEQLRAEGFLDARTGGGTFVASVLPDGDLVHSAPTGSTTSPVQRRAAADRLLRGMHVLADSSSASTDRPFDVGMPALDPFPVKAWKAAVARAARTQPSLPGRSGVDRGHHPLRAAIAARLAAVRGVRCSADQVFIVSGGQSGVRLCAELLVSAGDTVLVEDPCYLGTRAAYALCAADVRPVSVDDAGMRVADHRGAAPSVISVTPSCQFPTGATMSIARRLELLAYARRWDSWIVEDDYDSEFRFAGRPIAALQGLDPDGRVLYVGTFSKVMFPSLRIGYVVVPDHLVDTFSRGRFVAGAAPALLMQAALADFAETGQLDSHIRRMRGVYAEREAALSDELTRLAGDGMRLQRPGAGLHVLLDLPAGSDVAASLAADEAGVRTRPLSTYSASDDSARAGLILGFAPYRPGQLRHAARRLTTALAHCAPT